MENQLILRLPTSLKNINLSEASLTKIDDVYVTLEYKNVKYNGVISKLPTIIESQKILDGKLYKISDISGIIVISENNYFPDKNSLDDYLNELKISGITPPMKFVKERRFKKNQIKIEIVEEIERKVNQLLEEDSKAIKVEVSNKESEEIDLLAAEIENDLENDVEEKINNEISQKGKTETKEKQIKIDKNKEDQNLRKIKLLDLENKIKEKEEILIKSTNPIVKKRFEIQIKELKLEYDKLNNNSIDSN